MATSTPCAAAYTLCPRVRAKGNGLFIGSLWYLVRAGSLWLCLSPLYPSHSARFLVAVSQPPFHEGCSNRVSVRRPQATAHGSPVGSGGLDASAPAAPGCAGRRLGEGGMGPPPQVWPPPGSFLNAGSAYVRRRGGREGLELPPPPPAGPDAAAATGPGAGAAPGPIADR